MQIEWTHRKNSLNLAKHYLSFDLAQHVFDDPFQLNIQDRHEHGEERWQTIGLINNTLIILVAHTLNDQVIRIISARKATKKERKLYENV